MSQACYRWTTYPALRWDQPHFGFRAMPLPYGTTVQPPREIDGWVEWGADKCASLGLSPFYATTEMLEDLDAAGQFGRRLADRGVTFIGGGGGLFAGTKEQWEQGRAKFERQIRLAHAAGAKIVVAVNQDPVGQTGQPMPNGGLFYGHFSRSCPMDEQIDRMVNNFKTLMSLCEDLGVVLAFENHMDYRISEIVRVVEGVDSPWLRVNYDFANSWSVVEDQVEAARLAAPYTVMTHIKDMRLQAITTTGEPAFFHAPLGHGNVEILEILEIFAARTPNADALPHCLEVAPLPQYDPDHWVRLSIDWLKENAAQYFDIG